MSKSYDVIVIGAGNAGLGAAATCAQAGLSTLLLERHNLPGGSASSFVRGRFEFETALHELSGTGTADDPGDVRAMLDRLGVSVNWVLENTTFHLLVPTDNENEGYVNENGVRVLVDKCMPTGVENFCKALEDYCPGSYAPCKEIFRICEEFLTVASNLEHPDVKRLLKVLPDAMRLASHTVNEGLSAVGMPEKAQDLFNTYWSYMGAPPARFDCLYYCIVLYSYVKHNAGMPLMRSHEISLALDKAIRKYGGEIRYNSEVTHIITENGKPVGVEINGKEEIHVSHFICNAFPDFVMSDLLDRNAIPDKMKKTASARQIAASLTTVYLGLDCTAEELGFKGYSIFVTKDVNADEQYARCNSFDNGYTIINCLNNVIPDSSPEGTCTLFLTTITFGDVMKGVTPRDYKKLKTRVARGMIEQCEKALNISIIPHIEEIEIALPPTFSRYLNTPNGTPYGYRLDKWDSLMPRTISFLGDQPFENFLFCGAHQERGDGYGCAYYTGIKAGELTVKAVKKEKEGK